MIHYVDFLEEYDFGNERTIGARLIDREGKTNLYIGFKQRVSAGMDAYVIFGDPNAASTRSTVTIELSRLL